MFFSDGCLNLAMEGQHCVACAALVRYQELKETLNLSDVMAANMSRVIDFVSTFGIQQLLEFPGQTHSTDLLARVLDLCWHRTDQEPRITAMCAAIVRHCFQLSDEEVDKVAPLCCRMLLIDQANSYSIEHTLLLPGGAMETRHIAYATFSGASLLNHSCDPNIVYAFHLKTVAMRVTRPVAKGEQLFNRYIHV
jgi:SET domain